MEIPKIAPNVILIQHLFTFMNKIVLNNALKDTFLQMILLV
jgi:hypothetical protein